MNVADIIDILEENGLSEVEELMVEEDNAVVEFFYDFDRDELTAAKAYANEESDAEENSDEWNREWFIPYLLDLAKDNVEAVLEDINEELQLEGIIKEANIDGNNNDYIKFVGAFCTENCSLDLEEILNDYL
ncbi:hypothetical protein BH721_04615 [Clostridium baratii]|uniref:Uncharacterized protein n=1 Tax=Clostridium baratii TaxID=1561 RepID=A0A174TPG2_9CLOT|nr:hypothetical protein [Clostridium baratii]OPF52542.1 hypothetical protein A1M12_10820 [Clostridium baratii]OPF55990.1 hypothetical protein BH721_04615 [Clostridium baratii]OPF58416.1 hypothetical protein BH724_05965 [Clostridium baratii]OPF59628.1 hypothetical protein BH725_03310 [Clostridium baratii]CUQ08749.1 Uncharacterised protein [Clostridium baratii]